MIRAFWRTSVRREILVSRWRAAARPRSIRTGGRGLAPISSQRLGKHPPLRPARAGGSARGVKPLPQFGSGSEPGLATPGAEGGFTYGKPGVCTTDALPEASGAGVSPIWFLWSDYVWHTSCIKPPRHHRPREECVQRNFRLNPRNPGCEDYLKAPLISRRQPVAPDS